MIRDQPPHTITFRPLAASDFAMLTAWLAQPHVRRFYQKHPVTLENVALEYGAVTRGEEKGVSHLALCDGVPFAYLQCYRNVDYPVWVEIIGVAEGISVDLFIGEPAYLRRGLGQAALGAYLRLIAFPLYSDESRAYIAHEPTNLPALYCSKAVGFRPIGFFPEDGIAMVQLMIERDRL